MIFTVLQLRTGNETSKSFQITGHTTTVETSHFDLRNSAFFFKLFDLVPALT